MPLIFQPLIQKTKSGTLACVAADGYDTEGTRHRKHGSWCVPVQRFWEQLYIISYLHWLSLNVDYKLVSMCLWILYVRADPFRGADRVSPWPV